MRPARSYSAAPAPAPDTAPPGRRDVFVDRVPLPPLAHAAVSIRKAGTRVRASRIRRVFNDESMDMGCKLQVWRPTGISLLPNNTSELPRLPLPVNEVRFAACHESHSSVSSSLDTRSTALSAR